MTTANARIAPPAARISIEDLDALKRAGRGAPAYRLSNANVFVSPRGFHYIDYLDPVEDVSPEIAAEALTDAEIAYIETQLQSNRERFASQVEIVKQHGAIAGRAALDIGCGGGLFMGLLAEEGATVTGVELSDSRAQYAKTRYNAEIVKRPIEDAYWSQYTESFDIVSMWDVIEHVNFPASTVQAASRVLRRGGLMFIDTPCRDSFYHRVGEATYRLSRGKYPTFLNTMYSAHRFGHKQIFSTSEMRALLEAMGLEVLTLKKFHELSFPVDFYLKKLTKSDKITALALPLVKAGLAIFPVRNKMLVVARKP